MYLNIKSCVSTNNENSGFFFSNCGVRQGDNLSPVLFSMFLNDLEDHMISDRTNGITIDCDNEDFSIYFSILILLYADDTVILADNAEAFQDCLNSFNDYCSDWKLTVNTSKTKVLIFGARKTSSFSFHLGNSKLDIVDMYKYLGIFFFSVWKFSERTQTYCHTSKQSYALTEYEDQQPQSTSRPST